MKSFWKLKKGKDLKPRHSIWKTGLSARKPFRDSDKDKVIDIFDCQPHNRKKQGPEHEGSLMNGPEWKETRKCAGCNNRIRGGDSDYCADCRKGGLPRRKKKYKSAEDYYDDQEDTYDIDHDY